MRSSLGWGLTTLLGCNAVLGIPEQVVVLCEQSGDCPGGYCGSDDRCDDQQWALRFGDADDQAVAALDYYDGDREGPEPGRLVMVGSFEGQLDFGEGHRLESVDGRDAYVVALGPDGLPTWSHHFGGPGDQRATAIDIDIETGMVHVAGEFGGDLEIDGTVLPTTSGQAQGFVAQIDPAGSLQWARAFGGTQTLEVRDLVTVNGAPTVVGSYQGPWTRGPAGAFDSPSAVAGFLVSYDATATASVSSGFGASQSLSPCCVLIDPLTNDVLIGGRFRGDLDTGTAVLSSEGEDGFVFFLVDDPNGGPRQLSALHLGEPLQAFGTDSLARLSLALNVGTDTPGVSIFRLLADATTELVRAETPEGSAEIFTLTHNRDNETLVFGQFDGTLDLVEGASLHADDPDLFVVTIDEQWRLPPGRAWAFGGTGESTPTGIATDDDGYTFVVGTFDGELSLDNGRGAPVLVGEGRRDVFVARLRL
ncbi:MAG: hypothetical protein K0V04_22615 [Deltaproteobacteria bacterium]|nr:hypothetical protein [Deltaproteobacteria bacterium]